jgi:hypothetical protein
MRKQYPNGVWDKQNLLRKYEIAVMHTPLPGRFRGFGGTADEKRLDSNLGCGSSSRTR